MLYVTTPRKLMDTVSRLVRPQRMRVILLVACLGLLLGPTLSSSSSSSSRRSAALVNPRTTLQCHVRSYTFRATKPPIINENGDLVTCEGDVHVKSCWGRCDSSEIGDFKMPFKVSNHPVCTYTGRVSRTVRLTHCAGYPDPTVQVFDAAGCACRLCNSDFTSCENLNG